MREWAGGDEENWNVPEEDGKIRRYDKKMEDKPEK